MTEYRMKEVTELLGVSSGTLREWCDSGALNTVLSEGGHRVVEGKELARFIQTLEGADRPEELASRSPRNRFSGVITRVERDRLMAIVELRVGGIRVVSLLTREAADALNLQEGDRATAVVKSTSVMIETDV
jgi:molybdopterin-binding protein